MELSTDQFTQGAWLSMVGMGAGYAVLLAIVFVSLFVVPFAFFYLT